MFLLLNIKMQTYYLKTKNDRLKDNGIEFTLDGIKTMLINAVIKRIENTDRPVCAFLSGGLDSSVVCSIMKKKLNTQLQHLQLA